MKLTRLSQTALAAAAALAACARPPADDPRMVSEWMHTLYGVIRTERISPPIASRLMGFASVALYEGLAAADPALESTARALNGLTDLPVAEPGRRYDGTLIAVAAERVVLDSLLAEALPATQATLDGIVDSLRSGRKALGVTDEVFTRSDSLGRRLGLAIVAWSRADGFDSTRGRPYTAPAGEAFWLNDTPASNYASQNLSAATEFVGLDNPANNTRGGGASDRSLIMNRPKRSGLKALPPVNMAGATEPYWGWIRPFVLTAWNECPIPEPPAYSTDTSSIRYRDARHVYEVSRGLTPEQRTIALYWADNAGETGTPSGHWVSIASQMVSQRHLSAGEAARLFVATAVAQADAFIAAWGYKYKYSTIRPRTYIRRVIDPAWEPLIPTPPFPEYPAGHSTQSVAAAAAMVALLGDLPFEDSTGIALGPGVRTFRSFTAAALEAGESRIYGGIHFESGNAAGKTVGACIGRKVAERLSAIPKR
ncbi:MAG TPA: vanadium-dependent haloperoxidase [Gemmatimonadales bacterium]|nr:vanadium-dependent haloperoxidase [Gemmatimonadales bacterium]